MVTKAQLINGVADFMVNDMVQAVTETPLKIALFTLGQQLRMNGAIADRILSGSVVSMFLPEHEGGLYDVDCLTDSLKASIAQYGNFTLMIPAIPLISKGEKTLSFNQGDVEALKGRIERAQL